MSPAAQMGQGQGALSSAAALVTDAKHDFDRLDRLLIDHIDSARAQWAGHGGSAFVALGRAWSEKQRVIVGALDGFAASLRDVERDNSATDDAQSTAYARVQQRLA